MFSFSIHDFAEWRDKARALLAADVAPEHILWNGDGGLFGETPLPAALHAMSIQKAFLPLAENIGYHRDPEKWGMLYRAAWRLTHSEPHLLELSTDLLVNGLRQMEKQVARDAHKAKAFIRFRKVDDEGNGTFLAWHEPDHFILKKISPFMARRFADMRWSIFTPDESSHWDGEALTYGEGAEKSLVPAQDAQEQLWKDYYRATFNPARIKIKMMKSEMPVRYWKNLPETQIISDMLDEAPERVQQMLKYTQALPDSAEPFLPENRCIADLRAAAKTCEGCPLYKPATQTVFGEGIENAKLMIIGEQPGDEEDKHGKAFVGQAGKLLQKTFEEVGIKRENIYITNAVKHFKFSTMPNGKRLHRTPSQKEVNACKPWLDAEIKAVKPDVILGLGATAGKSLLGPSFTLSGQKGWQELDGAKVAVTYHPAAILRASSETQAIGYKSKMQNDLKHALEMTL